MVWSPKIVSDNKSCKPSGGGGWAIALLAPHGSATGHLFDSHQDYDQEYLEARSLEEWISEVHAEGALSTDVHGVLEQSCPIQQLMFPKEV